jgi:hypothetical protein
LDSNNKNNSNSTAIAAIVYGGYKSIRHAIGEENWNAIMKPKPKPNDNQQPAGQQNQAINQQVNDDDSSEDSYSEADRMRVFRGEGRDNSIRNEKIALDAEASGDDSPPVVYIEIGKQKREKQLD